MRTKIFIATFVLLVTCSFTYSQINNPLKVLKNKTSQKANNEIDKKADQVVNPEVNSDITSTDQNSSRNSSDQNNANSNSTSTASTTMEKQPISVTSYQNYDFRAGDKIIFEDNFSSDADGEFPAHWDLVQGQAVVNKLGGVPSFMLTDGNYCRVKPMMKTDSYLTDNFSIEYDIFQTSGAYGLVVYMYDANGDNNMSVYNSASEVNWSYSNTNSLNASLPTTIKSENYYDKWHHIAIAYKNDQLKVYVDQFRVLTVPHCGFKPSKVECAGIGDQNNPIIFKDFKVADGASMNMLDAIMTDGKFVTHGINFDVNSANLKPESMGVIGDVVKYMKDHPDLKLEIDGHTDADGTDDANNKLSQSRADAVKTAMVTAGIDASRLSTKGYGESKPTGTNKTPEGKAQNRRVEFVKV